MFPRKDGRHHQTPYRVRVGATWYWVDPSLSRETIEPGDTVVIYPADGDAVIAVVQEYHGTQSVTLANLDGTMFEMALADIEAMHLAAVDTDQ